jgi:hypothetical protein
VEAAEEAREEVAAGEAAAVEAEVEAPDSSQVVGWLTAGECPVTRVAIEEATHQFATLWHPMVPHKVVKAAAGRGRDECLERGGH